MIHHFKYQQKIIPFFLAVFMLISALPLSASAATRFPDAEGWSVPYINELADLDILHGYPDGTVRPGQNVTQAEYAALLTLKAGIEPGDGGESWDAKYSSALSRAGVIAAEESYTLNASITRMEIIAWTIRAMGGEKLAEREQETISFPDSAERTPEEKGYLAVSSDSGLIVGFPDGNAHPDNACTRGEAFAILCRYDAAKSYVEQALEAEPVYIPSVPVPTPPQPVIPEGEPITITAPEKVTATDPWEVSVTLRSDVTDVQWAMPNTGYEGTLDTQGGTLTFSNAGDYTLTLSGKDAKGDPVSRSVTVKVKELPPVRILAPATATVNQPWTATVQTTHNLWDSGMIVEREGGNGGYDGWLGNDGGTLTFFMEGTYTVTLSGRDDNGESVSGSITVVVSPEPVGLTVTGSGESVTTGGDYAVTVATTGNLWELNWTLTRNGETVWDGYGGDLPTWSTTSSIHFTEPGTWVLTLTGQSVEGTISDSITVEVTGNPIRQIASPSFTVPQQVYTDTDCILSLDHDPAEGVTVSWTIQPGSYTGTLGNSGGTIQFSDSGEVTLTATASDAWGNSNSFSKTFTINPKPHVRMNPLSRETGKERLDYVDILHLEESSTCYPDVFNVDGMNVAFSLLQNGQSVSSNAAYFRDNGTRYANKYSYTFKPETVGDYVVRATVSDEYGNSFTFDAKYRAVENVYVNIVDYEKTTTMGTMLSIKTEGHCRTNEEIRWSLEKIEDYEAQAQEYGWHEQEKFGYLLRPWRKVSLDDYATHELDDEGGTICFKEPGLYCLKTSVTDQYNYTIERHAVFLVNAQS